MSRDEFIAFPVGILVGGGLVPLLIISTSSYHSLAQKALTECESNIPRNKHCKVIAVPEGVTLQ